MIKKIFFFLLLFSYLFQISLSFWAIIPTQSQQSDTSNPDYYNNNLYENPLLQQPETQGYIDKLVQEWKTQAEIIQGFWMQSDGKCWQQCAENIKFAASENSSQESSASSVEKCEGENCFTSTGFIIDTSLFSPWGTEFLWQGTAEETINLVLGTIVRRLMVALWIISLLIMSIGAWFMILYWGKDENLTKWKTILKMWFIALFIALSSYTIISIVIFILYH
jgi:hypothetical protein